MGTEARELRELIWQYIPQGTDSRLATMFFLVSNGRGPKRHYPVTRVWVTKRVRVRALIEHNPTGFQARTFEDGTRIYSSSMLSGQSMARALVAWSIRAAGRVRWSDEG